MIIVRNRETQSLRGHQGGGDRGGRGYLDTYRTVLTTVRYRKLPYTTTLRAVGLVIQSEALPVQR